MPVTLKDIKKISAELKNRRPSALPQDPDAPLTNRQAVHQLAPTLLRLKKRGFKTSELIGILKEYDIKINAATMNRYLEECRAGQKSDDDKAVVSDNAAKQSPADKNASQSTSVAKPSLSNSSSNFNEVKK